MGTLRELQLQLRTLKRYREALERYFEWLDSNEFDSPGSRTEADELLADFVEFCWDAGAPRGHAADAICGLQHFVPTLRGELKLSWQLLKTWDRHEVPSRAPPLLSRQVLAMAGFALERRGHWRALACHLHHRMSTSCPV